MIETVICLSGDKISTEAHQLSEVQRMRIVNRTHSLHFGLNENVLLALLLSRFCFGYNYTEIPISVQLLPCSEDLHIHRMVHACNN